jgi:hypothetical protein
MTDQAPAIDFATLARRLEEGTLPRDFILHAARGLLPLAEDELLAVLAMLSGSEDEEVRSLAGTTLAEMPARSVAAFAMNQQAEGRHLDRLAATLDNDVVLEAVLRNRSTWDETIVRLAATLRAPLLQDIIVTNQERILRTPGILDALFENEHLAPDIRRRALEVREEFFDKQARLTATRPDTPLLEEEASLEGIDEIADLLEKAIEAPSTVGSAESDGVPPEPLHPDQVPAYNRILAMTVSERIRCAFKGGKSERAILIRDKNKLICTAVLRNGRISEQEIEGYASSRSVDDEVLRIIGTTRSWMAKYPIMLALTRNPKVPPGVVMPLLNRLTLKDLQFLGRDRGVSEVVRKTAAKIAATRTKHS